MSPRTAPRFPRWLRAFWVLLALTGAIFAQDIWRSRLEYFVREPETWSAASPDELRAKPAARAPGASADAADDFVSRVDSTIAAISGRPVFGTYSQRNARSGVGPGPVVEINNDDRDVAAMIDTARVQSIGAFDLHQLTQAATTTASSGSAGPKTSTVAPSAPINTFAHWQGTGTTTAPTSGNWSVSTNWDTGTPSSDNATVLGFGGSGSTAYTSTNDLGNFIFNTISLTSSASVAETIAGNTLVLSTTQDPNTFLRGSTISQNNTGAFIISNNISGPSTDVTTYLTLSATSSATPGTVTLSGAISNGSLGNVTGIIKQGTNTAILSGTNTFTGGIEIDDGTLLINGDSSAASGSVSTYSSGSVLGGTGKIGGNTFIFSGTITGDTTTTVGALTLTKNLSLASGEGTGGTYLANISGTTSDLVKITGSLTLGSGTTLDIEGSLDGQTTYTIATFSQLSGNAQFQNVMNLPSNYMIVYNSTDIELVPVPEPATWLAAGLACVGLLLVRQRRRVRSTETPSSRTDR